MLAWTLTQFALPARIVYFDETSFAKVATNCHYFGQIQLNLPLVAYTLGFLALESECPIVILWGGATVLKAVRIMAYTERWSG